MFEGGSKILSLEGVTYISLSDVRTFQKVGHLLVDEPDGLEVHRFCASFFTSCETTEFADTGHRREECQDKPVNLSMVLHAMRLKFEMSMELTDCPIAPASSGRTAEVGMKRLSQSQSPLGLGGRSDEDLAPIVSTWHIVLVTAMRDALFSHK